MTEKIALVTGAGRGIGKAIALALGRDGIDVAVNDIHMEDIKTTAAEIEALGQRAIPVKCDVSDYGEVNRMVEQIVKEWGGLDILVNNAGIATSKMWEDLEKADWDRVINVNLGSVLNCSKAVTEIMKMRGGGSIINMASMSAKSISDAASPDYTASKAGIVAFTRQLAYELGPYNIRVNAICPGTVMTPLTDIPAEIEKKLIDATPLRRLVKPEEVGNVIAFLVSDKAAMITGTTIDIDGGQRLGFLDWDTYVKVRKGG
jgi:3-oxoacyl-[acyl-carrier protein] reductase